ncbi:MAG: cupin domain-containing protein [Roseiflexaceae bacterium]
MIVYERQQEVPDTDLVDLGDPAGLGGRVISGNPKIAARFDFQGSNINAGIFEATTGVVEITFPFTEHATIIEGEVTITDQTGRSFAYKPGDSYFIRQGEVVLWEVKGKRVRKSFFHIFES